MPFVSDAQRRFAFGTHQPWAKKWGKETKGKDLPEKVRRKKQVMAARGK